MASSRRREGPRSRRPRGALRAGDRVFLRRPTPQDRDEYLRVRRASAELHRTWEPSPVPGVDPYGPEAFASFLQRSHEHDVERFFVCSRDDGRIVGNINLNNIVRGVFQSASLGYWVASDSAGRGYMTEGLGLVIEHAFLDLGLHRLEANIQPENVPSLALAKRCGFEREGYSPRYLKIAGRWRDHERWALLVERWRASRRRGDG